MNDNDNKEAILERQRQWAAALKPIEIKNSTYLLAPDDFKLHNVTHTLSLIETIHEQVHLHDLESFADYVNKYQEDDTMVVINSETQHIRAQR